MTFAGKQEVVYQDYSRARVFETLEKATEKYSNCKAMMIVKTPVQTKRYTLLGLELKREKETVTSDQIPKKVALLSTGRPL